MRILLVTRIFPSGQNPTDAPYNRQLYAALSRHCEVTVCCLHATFPGRSLVKPTSSVPTGRETIAGLEVHHRRVVYAPRWGRPLSGPLYVASLLPWALAWRGRVDLVVGSFAYPDGFAASALGRILGVPAAIQVLGSDINVFSVDPLLRPHIAWSLRHAQAVFGPSHALIDQCVALGAAPARCLMLPNGIDREVFRPRERALARRALGEVEEGEWIVQVGRLEPAKGVWDTLAAFERLRERRPGLKLVLVGHGVDRDAIERRAVERALPVLLPGVRDDVGMWMAAADVVTLPSFREGTPNAVLEALASGRRVVASNVGGIPDAMSDPVLGEMVSPGDPEALELALERVLDAPGDPETIVERARIPSWEHCAQILWDHLLGCGALPVPRGTAPAA
ncbi:MAG: glycosyltransferase [Myxococcales bacterium]|nr:glycosyltransferase [Myxococcales bacterium]